MPRPPPVTIATRPASGAPAAIDDVYTPVGRLATAVVTKTLPPGRKLQESRWFASPYPTQEEFEQGSTWPRISITPYLETRNDYIDEPRPASTGMGIRDDGLLVRKTILEVDMISIERQPGVEKQGFPAPEGVPSPLASYSPAIRNGDWVFLAGEIPVDW